MQSFRADELRELDHRLGDGIDVTLLWSRRTGGVFVLVVDLRYGDSFDLEVDPADALDAFRHPYAYVEHSVSVHALAA